MRCLEFRVKKILKDGGGSLGNFSLVRAKCREGSDDAVVFFKQNVRRALRGAKDKNSRGGDLYICWHGSASTSINRGLDDG